MQTVDTIVLELKTDGSKFDSQMQGMEARSAAAIQKAASAMNVAASARASIMANASNSVKTMYREMQGVMQGLSGASSGLKAEISALHQTTTATLQKLGEHRNRLAGEFTELKRRRLQIDQLFNDEYRKLEVSRQRNTAQMADLRMQRLSNQYAMNERLAGVSQGGTIFGNLDPAATAYQMRQSYLARSRSRNDLAALQLQTGLDLQPHQITQTRLTRQRAEVNARMLREQQQGELELQQITVEKLTRQRASNARRIGGIQDTLLGHDTGLLTGSEAITGEEASLLRNELSGRQMRQRELNARHSIQSAKLGAMPDLQDIDHATRENQTSMLRIKELALPKTLELKHDMSFQQSVQQYWQQHLRALKMAMEEAKIPFQEQERFLRNAELMLKSDQASVSRATSLLKGRQAAMLLPVGRREDALRLIDTQVEQERMRVQSQATGVMGGMTNQLTGLTEEKHRAAQERARLAQQGGLGSRMGGGALSQKWNWRGAMFGGMLGGLSGGLPGSIIGAGAGGMFGAPGVMASFAGITAVEYGIIKPLSLEVDIASKLLHSFIHIASQAGHAAIQLSMDWERATTSFEILTGSETTGRNLLNDIRNLAVKTPYTISQLTSPAQLLLGYGVKSANIVPSLGRLGDIAGGDPERLGRLGLAFGQVMAHGRLQGQELRQFAEVGVGAEDFATSMGVSTPKLRDMMEAGIVPASVMVDTINRLTDAGGRFAGMSARQLKTVSGSWNSLRETVEIVLEKTGTAFLKGFGAAGQLTNLQQMIEANIGSGSAIEKWFEAAGKGVQNTPSMALALGQAGMNTLNPILGNMFGVSAGDIASSPDAQRLENNLLEASVTLAEFTNWLTKANLSLVLFGYEMKNAFDFMTGSRIPGVGSGEGFLGDTMVGRFAQQKFQEFNAMQNLLRPDIVIGEDARNTGAYKARQELIARGQGDIIRNEITDNFNKRKTQAQRQLQIANEWQAISNDPDAMRERGWAMMSKTLSQMPDGTNHPMWRMIQRGLSGSLDYVTNNGFPSSNAKKIGYGNLANDPLFAQLRAEKTPLDEYNERMTGINMLFDRVGGQAKENLGLVGQIGIQGLLRQRPEMEARALQLLEKGLDKPPTDWRGPYTQYGTQEAMDAINAADQEGRHSGKRPVADILEDANKQREREIKALGELKEELQKKNGPGGGIRVKVDNGP